MPTTTAVLFQSILSFLVLFVIARILGKRQVAQLSFFDYIAGITLGDIASVWSLDDVKTSHAILSLLIWTGLSLLLVFMQRKSYRARLIIDGRPKVLIQNGQVLEKNLKKANVNIEELMGLLRDKDVFKLSDVEYAVFENNGQLSIMKKSEVQPVTPKDLGLVVIPELEPRILIIDGHVMEKSLKATGYTKEWLLSQVQAQGASDFRDVFLAQIDSSGNVYVDLYKDKFKQPEVKEKPLILATLKKIQADFEGFALETENLSAKELYVSMANKVKNLISYVSPYLRE